jgi:EpsI family protein
MTISRLLILQALLACGLGTVFFIPRQTQLQPCRIRMELPSLLGGWAGKPAIVTQKEHDILAGDTQFCRKVYEDGLGDQVLVSIVLSGHDLDNSIHRPERCLPTQGWAIESTTSLSIPVPAAPGGSLPVTRLYNMREATTKSGQVVKVHNVIYYWFVGYSDITASHFEREYLDMKDRLLHGYNQRWAYVTVASNVTRGLTSEGAGRDGGQIDAMLQGMIQQVYPLIVMDKAEQNSDQNSGQ